MPWPHDCEVCHLQLCNKSCTWIGILGLLQPIQYLKYLWYNFKRFPSWTKTHSFRTNWIEARNCQQRQLGAIKKLGRKIISKHKNFFTFKSWLENKLLKVHSTRFSRTRHLQKIDQLFVWNFLFEKLTAIEKYQWHFGYTCSHLKTEVDLNSWMRGCLGTLRYCCVGFVIDVT